MLGFKKKCRVDNSELKTSDNCIKCKKICIILQNGCRCSEFLRQSSDTRWMVGW